MADLEDNMDLSRLPNPTEKDLERTEKYRGAHAILEAACRQVCRAQSTSTLLELCAN